MAMRCTVCSQRYPAHARYCALCGRPLVVLKASPETRNVALVLAVIIAAATTLAVFGAAKISGARGWITTPATTVYRDFNLSPDKADAMFRLLAPRDIKVIVGRYDQGVNIQGTPREVAVLADFVELITRYRGQSAGEVRSHINYAKRHGAKTRAYKVSKSKGRVLYEILAADDVPVLVSGSARKVRVEAMPHDHETLRQVVKILRGRRL